MTDLDFMTAALKEAQTAGNHGEIPVGAVVVKDGKIIATGRNAPIAGHDPTAHAEIVALRAAAKALGNYRLDGCELFVTLEPCAMCAGAMLHARLKRVVFGAADPKTGAAGSVVNLFTKLKLNHQTAIQGEVMATESMSLLKRFFKEKREANKTASLENHPLRSDALRTPDAAFEAVPDYPWQPEYISNLPTLDGLRMHYLDEGASTNKLAASLQTTYLCLHGNPTWSYLYRKMIPILLNYKSSGEFSDNGLNGGNGVKRLIRRATNRVIAPDLIGFGKSDKPKKDAFHTFSWHRQVLIELIERLDLRNVVLVVQDWGGILGLTLPHEFYKKADRFKGLVVMNTALGTGDEPLTEGFLAWQEMCRKKPDFAIDRLFARGNPRMSEQECAAYMAPFPDKGFRAATRAFPQMVPSTKEADGAAISRQARAFWQKNWQGQTLMAIGAQDPVLGAQAMLGLQMLIKNCPTPMVLEQAGHFVQEDGEEVAMRAVRMFCCE